MFYRLLKISGWAKRNPKIAILVITLLEIVFILLGLYLGHFLYKSGIVLGRPFLFVGFMLIINGLSFFPHRDEIKEYLVDSAKFWRKIAASMLIFLGAMILLVGYAGKRQFKSIKHQGIVTEVYAIETAPSVNFQSSILQNEYASKFIVNLSPKRELGFWRTLVIIFLVLLLIAIGLFTAFLFCASLCAGNFVLFALLVLDSILFFWGAIYWLSNNALTPKNKYNLGVLLAILIYATLAASIFLIGDLESSESVIPFVANFLVSLFVFFWGHNLPLFRFKPKKAITKE